MEPIDLNADLGEGFGRWSLTDDAGLLEVVTSANVACGFHAGDPSTMRRVCEQAVRVGVRVGAQVSYRDLAGFGRRAMDVPAGELADEITYQIGALDVFARAAGDRVRYVKPHGALYNRVVDDAEQAAAVVAGVQAASPDGGGLPVLGLPGSALLRLASAAGMEVVAEGFVDRAYTAAGTLVSRRQAGAVLTDEAAVVEQAVRLAGVGEVVAVTGEVVAARVRSLCVHGDTPGATKLARRLRAGARCCRRPNHPVHVRALPCGEAALLVEVSGHEEVWALYAELLRRRESGQLAVRGDIVPAARTVLIDGVDDPPSLAAAITTWSIAPVAPASGPLVRLPTVYDGEDLDEVANRWGVSADGVVEIHTGTDFRVAFCGFAPGFAYLVGLADRYHVPRRATPRATVPAGSVGVAGEFTGVYPRVSPGGWQLIGRTSAVLWDPRAWADTDDRPGPALLAPGIRVRFVPERP